jgi:dienelactone hydrolase
MAIRTEKLVHDHKGSSLEAVVAYPDTDSVAPGIMIFSDWSGRGPHAEDVAQRLAALGYVGFAADMYGDGRRGSSKEENTELMNSVASDRAFLQDRLNAICDKMASLPEVDAGKLAASGYCFGGLCALDAARAGLPVKGVAAFHAILAAPGNTDGNKISAKVLALHGWDDPMATPDDVNAFAKEMSAAQADWQLHAYGNTLHAFTNKEANDPDFGTVYSKSADDRSWQAFTNFLEEIFA